MSKRFKGQICPYCGIAAAKTADHVLAREFFLVHQRANLPKVPACEACNRTKSVLEHYLASVLPFAGRHADASQMLSQEVPRRLAKNLKLHRRLQQGHRRFWMEAPSGLLVRSMTIDFDGEKLTQLCAYIVRGLYWHHWQEILPPDIVVEASLLTRAGEAHFGNLLVTPDADHVFANLGSSTVMYGGMRLHAAPTVTV